MNIWPKRAMWEKFIYLRKLKFIFQGDVRVDQRQQTFQGRPQKSKSVCSKTFNLSYRKFNHLISDISFLKEFLKLAKYCFFSETNLRNMNPFRGRKEWLKINCPFMLLRNFCAKFFLDKTLFSICFSKNHFSRTAY